MGWRSTAVLLAALAAGCAADGARGDGGQGTGGDADTDTESDSSALVAMCSSACAEATSADECAVVPVEQQPVDYSLFCWWAELTAPSAAADGGCGGDGDGGVLGRCYCTKDFGWGADEIQEVDGCGEVAGQPAYAVEDGKTYVGLVWPPPCLWSEIYSCAFNLEGEASPAECSCLCDWPQDPAFACDYVNGVCTDANSGLMWTQEPANTGWGVVTSFDLLSSATACDDVADGGFDDWRVPTIDELRTLIRGCPQNGAGGACAISEGCADVSCAGAECVECSVGGSDAVADPCDACGGFVTGDCAWCEPMAGPGLNGWYLPVELEWTNEVFWSSTPATPLPDGDPYGGYAWFVDFSVGAPEVTAESGTFALSALVVCVRDL
jgi:hypothetical protein